MIFYSFDLDLDRMILVLTLGPEMVLMYLHTKNEVYSLNRQTWTDRQTSTHRDRQTHSSEIITYLHTWMVIMNAIHVILT